ncbi:hypothetical protein [Paenibacillus sp. IHBB 3054]|uniref:hypothetical protein n=1 Tax=Paenibacillus sp. IHBB 3054 TaxID=3425689 RepID=UPI003F67512D
MNADFLSRAVKEYALHILYEEVTSFSKQELTLIEKHDELWSLNNSLIAGNEYFEDPNAFIEYYTEQYLYDLCNIKYNLSDDEEGSNKLRSDITKFISPKLVNKKKSSEELGQVWHQYSKKSGSLYRNIFDRKFNKGKMTLTRQLNRIVNKAKGKDDSKVFSKYAFESTDLFLKKMTEQASEHDPKEELNMFERDTDMLLIFDAVHKILSNPSSKPSKYNKKGLKIISSFALIDDYKIRSAFLLAFHRNDGLHSKYIYMQGYKYFFLFNFMLIPFLIIFLRNMMYSLVPLMKDSRLINLNVDPNSYDELKKIHMKLSLNKLTKRPRKEALVNKIKIMDSVGKIKSTEDYKEVFMSLYSEIKGIRIEVNRNIKDGDNFFSLIDSKSKEWIEENIEEIRNDTNCAMHWLTKNMADDFMEISRLHTNKEKKITFKKLVNTFEAYFRKFDEEEGGKEYTKFLNEIRNRGWNL